MKTLNLYMILLIILAGCTSDNDNEPENEPAPVITRKLILVGECGSTRQGTLVFSAIDRNNMLAYTATGYIYTNFNNDNTYSIKYLVEIHNSITEQTTTHERDETGIFSYTYPGNNGIITLYPEEGESWQIGYSLDMVRCLIFLFESGAVIFFFKDCYDTIFVEKEGSS